MEEKLRQQMQMLDRLYKESDRVCSNYSAHFGMNDTAFWVLYALSHTEGTLTQNDLCAEWFIPAQTINSAVSGLVKRGLVRLEQIPGTKNRKSILLTPAGEKFCRSSICRVDEIEREALLAFSEEERETYLALFRRHIENLKRASEKVFGAETEDMEKI